MSIIRVYLFKDNLYCSQYTIPETALISSTQNRVQNPFPLLYLQAVNLQVLPMYFVC